MCGWGVEWLRVSRLNDTVPKTLSRSRRDTEEWGKCHDVALARRRPGIHVTVLRAGFYIVRLVTILQSGLLVLTTKKEGWHEKMER